LKDRCLCGHDTQAAITAALDDAHADGDKAGYERGVRESEKVLQTQVGTVSVRGARGLIGLDEASEAILSLLAPPVWQHKPDCPTPYQWHESAKVWFYPTPLEDCCPTRRATHCDGCGEPKPVTEGS
jgi:hypothetical protein